MTQKEKRDLYSGKKIQIPSPRFVVFYNGTEEQPERKILRLSDSFYRQTEEANLELTVLQLNINPGLNKSWRTYSRVFSKTRYVQNRAQKLGHNKELLGKCRSLHDYMKYVERVRSYSREMDFQEAVERAVSECIEEGILVQRILSNWQFDLPIFLIALLPKP
ncbi:MAG: hypothetical protein HFG34_03515 [Eubacterium sp.]|nr:hypothetical protein [Eubacterium sp.]